MTLLRQIRGLLGFGAFFATEAQRCGGNHRGDEKNGISICGALFGSVALWQEAERFLRGARMVCAIIACAALVCGCKRDDMADQPRVKVLGVSTFYPDGAGARMPVEHTVTRDGPLEEDSVAWRNPVTADKFPFAITRADLMRGEQVFEINCTPCHGLLGDGDGMVPERGFTRPPTYHCERLRAAPPSYFYNVITNGIGAMYSYADRVKPDDRWRVAAYIRALQLSQDTPVGSLSADDRAKMNAGGKSNGGGP